MTENKFSRTWKSSVLPRKQRKYRYNAPLHLRNKLIHSHLSKDLIKKHNLRSISVRTGDKVKISRGQFKSKIGKVNLVDLKKLKIFIEGIETIKKDGNKSFYPIDPSNVVITELNLEDKRRIKSQSTKSQSTKTVTQKSGGE